MEAPQLLLQEEGDTRIDLYIPNVFVGDVTDSNVGSDFPGRFFAPILAPKQLVLGAPGWLLPLLLPASPLACALCPINK